MRGRYSEGRLKSSIVFTSIGPLSKASLAVVARIGCGEEGFWAEPEVNRSPRGRLRPSTAYLPDLYNAAEVVREW